MNQFKKIIKDNKLLLDILNVLFGIVVIVLTVLYFLVKENQTILFLIFMVCGIMNISNGLKYYQEPKKRSMGMSLIMIGAIIMMVDLFIYI